MIVFAFALVPIGIWGQVSAADSTPQQTDSIDRYAEDFITASLLVADPGRILYSTLGHACLRMQCPTYDLDYCFTYESEAVEHRVWSFLAGKLEMALFAVPTADYCATYREEGRGVREYTLNLSPETKSRLWQILDETMMAGNVPYDYLHRGCAIACLHFVKEALGEQTIDYAPHLFQTAQTTKDGFANNTYPDTWSRLFLLAIAGGESEQCLTGDEQLIAPADLANAWQQATVEGIPLVSAKVNTLVAGAPQREQHKVTPSIAALLLLLLAVANLFVARPYIDWFLLALQTTVGCFMVYLVFLSDLCGTQWNWLLIPFNPLPILFWRWRRYWAIPYAAVLVVWCIAMVTVPHVIVDVAHIILATTLLLLMLKQTVIYRTNSTTQDGKK